MRQFSRPHLYSQLQILGTQVWSFEVLYSSKAAALACPAAEGRPSLCHVLFFTRPLLPHIQNLMVAVGTRLCLQRPTGKAALWRETGRLHVQRPSSRPL